MEEKLKELKKQREIAKELFLKCQGAIELIEQMIKEKSSDAKKPETKNKKDDSGA
jgi:predicted transcriptional regulator